jgi:hypothetical protein
MVNWNIGKKDLDIIDAIVERAMNGDKKLDALNLTMDLSATHKNGNPLDFKKLLFADEFTFNHDVYGIMHHMNRENGKLGHGFMPRCTYHKPAKKVTVKK